MNKRQPLFALLIYIFISSTATAFCATSDWFLYFWSNTSNAGGDVATFETTDNENIFVIDSCIISEQGIKFGVHNDDWSIQYGWSEEGGNVTSTGQMITLAFSTGATGWCELPAGAYDVTFDYAVPSIRFDIHVDSHVVNPGPSTVSFLRGADLTMATYIEDWGGVFRYHDGTPGDVFDILQSYGVNLARLRLYNTPGTAVKDGSTTYRTPIITTKHPNGYPYGGQEDILNLAKRAKEHDMKICLTLNMTDYWSNATMQMIPAEWASATTHTALCDSVYNFTYRYVKRMVDQGTTPEYVSVGNETNMGMLFQTIEGNAVSYGGKSDNISQMVALYNKAYDAIKDASPNSQVIIHHSYGHAGKISTCRSFFQTFKTNGGKFDIVGGSYYPYWASAQGASGEAQSPTGMLRWAADMKSNIDKPVMIMEVGYSWTQYRPSGRNGGNYEGQLHLNGSYYNEATEEGQTAFMHELHEALKKDNNILGYMYWDPIFVDQKVGNSWIKTCWAEKYSGSGTTWWEDGNVISNTTWFDYSGYPLKALWLEIASFGPESGFSTELVAHPSSVCKYIQQGQLYIVRDNKTYNAIGCLIY